MLESNCPAELKKDLDEFFAQKMGLNQNETRKESDIVSEKKNNALADFTDSRKTDQIPIKHIFTKDEITKNYEDLRLALNSSEQAEADFDAIKQQWKTTLSLKAAEVMRIRGLLNAGFEMRPTDCKVYYDVKAKRKHYVHEDEIVFTTEMAPSDFQVELQLAQAKFEPKQEINLFPPTAKEHAILVLGKFKERWYTALHIAIGTLFMEERLDVEKKGFKVRFEAVQFGAKAALATIKSKLDKDVAKGFEEPIGKAVEAEKDKVE